MSDQLGGMIALGISLLLWGFIAFAMILVIKDVFTEEKETTSKSHTKK